MTALYKWQTIILWIIGIVIFVIGTIDFLKEAMGTNGVVVYFLLLMVRIGVAILIARFIFTVGNMIYRKLKNRNAIQQSRKFKYEYLISGTILSFVLVFTVLYFNPLDLFNDLGLKIVILTFAFPFLAGILGFLGLDIVRYTIETSLIFTGIYVLFFSNCYEGDSLQVFLCVLANSLIFIPGIVAIILTGIVASSLRVIFKRGKFLE